MRVYICNLMTQANESLGLRASEHIERIYEHTRAPIFDYAIVNTAPVFAGDSGPLRCGKCVPHRSGHRTHRGARRPLHRRRLCQRRERGPPRCRPRHRRFAGLGPDGHSPTALKPDGESPTGFCKVEIDRSFALSNVAHLKTHSRNVRGNQELNVVDPLSCLKLQVRSHCSLEPAKIHPPTGETKKSQK